MYRKNIKKRLFLIIMSVLLFFVYSYVYANTQCFNIDSDNVCLTINQDNNWYNINTNISNTNTIPIINCQIRTPERVGATIYYIPGCKGKFQYEGSDRGYFTIYLNYNNNSETLKYDLSNQTWSYLGGYEDNQYDDTNYNYDDNYQSDNVKKIYLSVSNSTIDVYDKIDLYIKPKDIYNNTVNFYYETLKFKIYKQDSYGYYNEVGESYYWIKNNSYNITFNHQSYETLQDYIYFKKEGKYKIKIYQSDDLDVYGYVYINVDDNRNNGSYYNTTNNKYKILATINDNTPDTYQRLDLYLSIKDTNNYTIQNFSDTISFYVLYLNPYTNKITLATSTEYEKKSSTIEFNYYNYGNKILNDFIRFKKRYKYYLVFSSSKASGVKIIDMR